MSQTDPIAEMLTRIRNAIHARYNDVALSHSRLREAIVRVLAAEGFLEAIEIEGEGYKRQLKLKIRYAQNRENREPVIRGLQRVSKPSLRVYSGAERMPRAAGGMGMHVVSTPLGVMTDREARRKKVGGEILLRVW
jgi:small subunit ribosomal protein S8